MMKTELMLAQMFFLATYAKRIRRICWCNDFSKPGLLCHF